MCALNLVCHSSRHNAPLFLSCKAEDIGIIWEHLHLLSHFLKANVIGYDYTGYARP